MKCNVVKVCPRGLRRYRYVIDSRGCFLSFLFVALGRWTGRFVLLRLGERGRSPRSPGERGQRWRAPAVGRRRPGEEGAPRGRASSAVPGELPAPDAFPSSWSVVGNSVGSRHHYGSHSLHLPRAAHLLRPPPAHLAVPPWPHGPQPRLPARGHAPLSPFSLGKATGRRISPPGLCTSADTARPQHK